MKKTIAIILSTLIIFWACGGGESGVTITPTPNPPVIIPPEPEPDQEPEPRTIFIYNAAKPEIGSSDGVNYYQMSDGHAVNSRDGFVAIGDILHGVDGTGESIISSRLPVVPDAVAISGDVWSFKNIDPAMAQSLGAMARWYTKIYQGPDGYGNWTDNQYQIVEAIVTDSGDIITLDTIGKYRNVRDSNMVVNYAGHNGLLIHSIDLPTRRASIRDGSGDYRVPFSENYFLSSRPYIEAGGVYYSWNGHTFANGVLTERATIMHEFVTLWYADRPVLAAVGSRIEHSEAVTYWVECNTGWLYRHTPSIDALEPVIQLWQGSGARTDGLLARVEVKPVMTDNNLFFGWNGTIWKYNFNDALVSSFAAGVEIWRM